MAKAARDAMGKNKMKALADRRYFSAPQINVWIRHGYACDEVGGRVISCVDAPNSRSTIRSAAHNPAPRLRARAGALLASSYVFSQ